jgi:uncharacterized membrane protein
LAITTDQEEGIAAVGRAEPDAIEPGTDTDRTEPTLEVGLVAAPGLPSVLTAGIMDQLQTDLEAAFPSVAWELTLLTERALVIPPAGLHELVHAVRRELLQHDWSVAVCVTDLPLFHDGRPIASHVSLTHGVGVVSLPALGVVQLVRRLREHILEAISALVCEDPGAAVARSAPDRIGQCGGRAERVLRELARRDGLAGRLTPVFVVRIAIGHVRLLLGMLRANQPWRLAARLHRALFAAFAVSAYVLVTPEVWRIADALEPVRLALLTAAAAIGTIVSLIVGHHLWERSVSPESRPQVVLFNLATTLTVTCGVLVLYAAQFAVLLGAALLVLKPSVLAGELHHGAHIADYLKVVWLAASLATTGGALGAALESDNAVREAAYSYRSSRGRTRSEEPPTAPV